MFSMICLFDVSCVAFSFVFKIAYLDIPCPDSRHLSTAKT